LGPAGRFQKGSRLTTPVAGRGSRCGLFCPEFPEIPLGISWDFGALKRAKDGSGFVELECVESVT
jgi:hypothetical protein